VLARLGRRAEAEPVARSAVALAETTDFLNVHADALRDLAEVLGPAGGADAAAEARDLYARKGNVVSGTRL
jgi:hypothetical protein